jgi:GNAT superfamily N-acetyltransferase
MLRSAEPRDVPAIVGLIRELADFEKLSHLVQVTPQSLQPHLFGERPAAEAVVAEREGQVVGFALFFTNFSTFLGQPGLYLEDLYVQPAHRSAGVGRALLPRQRRGPAQLRPLSLLSAGTSRAVRRSARRAG